MSLLPSPPPAGFSDTFLPLAMAGAALSSLHFSCPLAFTAVLATFFVGGSVGDELSCSLLAFLLPVEGGTEGFGGASAGAPLPVDTDGVSTFDSFPAVVAGAGAAAGADAAALLLVETVDADVSSFFFFLAAAVGVGVLGRLLLGVAPADTSIDAGTKPVRRTSLSSSVELSRGVRQYRV